MATRDEHGLALAEEVLAREPEFHALTGRYIGIIGAHAELWAAQNIRLWLPETGVSEGADAVGTAESPSPIRAGDRIQIKARGHETMHVTFRVEGIEWLLVVAYDLRRHPVRREGFCFSVRALGEMATRFEQQAGRPVIPVRWKGDTHLRLEWSALRGLKSGRVRGSTDTWEERRARAKEILSSGYRFGDGALCEGVEFAPAS